MAILSRIKRRKQPITTVEELEKAAHINRAEETIRRIKERHEAERQAIKEEIRQTREWERAAKKEAKEKEERRKLRDERKKERERIEKNKRRRAAAKAKRKETSASELEALEKELAARLIKAKIRKIDTAESGGVIKTKAAHSKVGVYNPFQSGRQSPLQTSTKKIKPKRKRGSRVIYG